MDSLVSRLVYILMRGFFFLLYHPLAFLYDSVAAAVSFGKWQEWVRVILPELTTGKILELGFGTGHLQVEMKQAGRHAYGLDESPNMVRIAQRRLQKEGPGTPWVGLVRGRSEKLPFQSESLDTIVATFPSEYIFHPDTIAECWRCLSRGGQLVVLLGVQIGGKSWLKRVLRGIYRITHQANEAPVETDRYLDMFKEVGFRIVSKKIMNGEDQLIILKAEKL